MPTEQLVTSTGWRFVGRAASLVADATVGQPSVEPGRDQDVLYAARFQLRPRIGNGSVVRNVLATLHAAIAREWQDAPPLTPDRPLHRPPGRFHGVKWLTSSDDGAWTGELIWRHAHPTVAGAPCTTHVIIAERTGHSSLTIRVSADDGVPSMRGFVGAGQARPAFLPDLARSVRLLCEGRECVPMMLEEDEIEQFVRDVLLSEAREHPVAVVAPLEKGGYVVSLTELGDELLGLARLYVIGRHASTFRLTDSLGDRRLSCYWGALRIYMPGFSCAERPEEHPLLMHDRLVDPVMRAGLLGKLGRHAASRVKMPPGVLNHERGPATPLGARVMTAAPVIAAAPPAPTPEIAVVTPMASSDAVAAINTQLTTVLGALPPLFAGLDARLNALASTITQLVAANTVLADEITRLRTTTALRTTGAASLERRFETLQQTLQQHFAPGEAPGNGIPESESANAEEDAADAESGDTLWTLVDVIRQAATSHADALLLLDGAERSAAESPYEDLDRLAVVLDAMASIARRRQEGALGTSLRVAFRELGIDYRGGISPSTPERLRRQYIVHGADGREFDCHEHIVLGNSYDPRHCLRVYFTSRAPVEPRFVIGHVGRHFEVKSTT